VLLNQQRKIDGDISSETQPRVMFPSFSIYESNLLKCFLIDFVSLACLMVRKFDAPGYFKPLLGRAPRGAQNFLVEQNDK